MNNRSKYNVDNSPLGKLKRTYNEILFDSQLECRFYKEYLMSKLKTGEIKSIKRQVRYELLPSFIYKDKKQRAVEYVSDFDVLYNDGHFIVIDVKGMVKPIDKLKSKLFKYKYPNTNFVFMRYSKEKGWHTEDKGDLFE